MNPQDPEFVDMVVRQTMTIVKERRASDEKKRQQTSLRQYGHRERGVPDVKYLTKEEEHRLVVETTLKMAGLT